MHSVWFWLWSIGLGSTIIYFKKRVLDGFSAILAVVHLNGLNELVSFEAEECDDDGIAACPESSRPIPASQVRERLPCNYEVREVTVSHRKPCADCGKSDWEHGDNYVFDGVLSWGSDKFCLDCALNGDWL